MVKSFNADRMFSLIVYAIMSLVAASTLFPMFYVFSVSVTPFSEVLKHGGFIVIPKDWTWSAYRYLWSQPYLGDSIRVTVFITVVGTAVNLVLTILTAYPLSRKLLPLRSTLIMFIMFTFLFNGGIVPTYLVVKGTGLLDSVWAMILPNAIATFNVLIMKSFFENVPEEIFESARIDGAKEFTVLLRIVIPLSLPSLMTVGLFYLVSHWNEFFQAIMYITKRELLPLQVVIRNLLMLTQQQFDNPDEILPTLTVQMASIVTASLPIIAVYPFIQRHLMKGMIIGSLKG
jgi:putative aldouronate transport system permease protein